MKKRTKPILVLVIVLLFAAVFPVSAYARESAEASFDITLLNQNVAGLPIPAAFSKTNKVVGTAQIALGKILNSCGCDIVCVQEDFQYHAFLSAQMTNYPYKTITSGGVPMGDGLNIFSKYPIYNVVRVAWEQAYGILDDYSDELTPKGFLKCTILVNDTYIDVYDVHFDAGFAEGDMIVKKAQLQQITAFIRENSKDNPVVIVGDYNMTFHTDAEFYPILIEENGFTDAWVHCVNSDDYFQGADAADRINAYYEKYAGYSKWGHWDSLERVCTRSSADIAVEATAFSYIVSSNDAANPTALTDHRASHTVLHLEVKAQQAEEMLEKEKPVSAVTRAKTFVSCARKSLKLIISDLFH